MSDPFIDTDVIIRLLTNDDPQKGAAARALFERVEVGAITVAAPVTVMADAVHVLSSPRLYGLPRAEVAALLSPLVRLPHFRLHQRPAVLHALDLYGQARLDFGDALIVAAMEQVGAGEIYSYDTDLDRIGGIARREP